MLTDFLKFIHLLLTLSLLGSAVCCLILASLQKNSLNTLTTLNRTMLWLLVFTVITGTLLVYPKHFNFHTPWIQAAYVLVFLCGTLISLLLACRKKYQGRWLWGMSYLFLLGLLVIVVHDAASKTTFLPWVMPAKSTLA